MYALGKSDANFARILLDHVPAIEPSLIRRVADQINESGLLAVMLGPLKGIPYKIYAVECGARRGGFVAFVLISIPARYVRFFLAAAVARLIAKVIQPLTHGRAAIELAILVLVWVAFYGFYFTRFGW